MVEFTTRNVVLALESLPALPALAAQWTALEQRAHATVFTSWALIGTWLRDLPPSAPTQLLVARHGERTVGLAILVQGQTRIWRNVQAKSWFLHSMGDGEHDGLDGEYNGFLLDRDAPPDLASAMLLYLLQAHGPARLEVSSAQGQLAELARTPPAGLVAQVRERRSYLVSLSAARQHEGGYLGMLSANTRAQIRRSIKAYEALGPLRTEAARTREEAHAHMAHMRTLHARRWQGKDTFSHFAQAPAAQRFHARLIDEAFDQGVVQLLRISAGGHDVGYLYNLVYQGRVAYYQSGLRFGLLDKHDRPGMVAHALAIEHNQAQGHQWYDFMAGDYRYKNSMSTHQEEQAWCSFQRDGLSAKLERALRRVKAHTERALASAEVPQVQEGLAVPLAAQALQLTALG